MSWNALQRETLEAMGFSVLCPLTAVPADAAAEPAAPASRHAGDRDASTMAGVNVRADTRADVRPAIAPPVSRRLAAAEAGRDRLAQALLRAAGRAPDAADASDMLAQWPHPDRLRRDPAAKRALWPQLRALRRART